MIQYEFERNWNPKIHVTTLSKLGSSDMFKADHRLNWIRTLYEDHQLNKVQFRIEAAKNENDVPEKSQLNAINYILNNEKKIYQSIYENLIQVVYPYYSELYEEDLQEYAPLSKIDNLPKVLGLVEITVNLMNQNDTAWCTYMFQWKGEEEHGLSMLFEGSKFLKHSGAGDMWFNEIVPKEELETLRKEWNIQMPKKMYYPNQELRSYKPWQLQSTLNYLLNLLKENKIDEFKNLVAQEEFDVNQKFPADGFPLIEEVVRKGFFEAGKYLFDMGAKIDGLMHFGNPYYENTYRIEFVHSVNGNINETNEENLSLLEKYLTIAKREYRFKKLEAMDLYEKHIKLLLKYGSKIEDKEKFENVLKDMNLWND